MKYIDEYRNKKLVLKVSYAIEEIAVGKEVKFMEVCGTHTHNFLRFGLDKLIPRQVRLISGPGCPVCVSSQAYIDRAVELAKLKEVIILSFGDMLKVPGNVSSLDKERAAGADVRVLYSPLESIRIAQENENKKVIFFISK